MNILRRWLIVGSVLLGGAAFAAETGLPGWYEPDRDPFADLEYAKNLAEQGDKHILLVVGGDWCSWCHTLDRFIKQNESVEQALNETFVTLKINVSEDNYNEAFLENLPSAVGYPHFYVLSHEGKVLASQQTAELESFWGWGYSKRAFRKFIEQY